MDADGLPIIGAGIDFSKVDPIPHKRSLACINHFMMHTTSFLNRFACVCEEKLENLTIRIQRLETTMNILESKLCSIPGLDAVTVTKSQPLPNAVTSSQSQLSRDVPSDAANTNANANTGSISNGVSSPETNTAVKSADASEPMSTTTTSAVNDPRYAKFFTLLKHGVPKEALAPKMLLEGLDPALLDNPSAPVAPPVSASAQAKAEQENDSDFSDSDNRSDSLSDNHSSDDDLSD